MAAPTAQGRAPLGPESVVWSLRVWMFPRVPVCLCCTCVWCVCTHAAMRPCGMGVYCTCRYVACICVHTALCVMRCVLCGVCALCGHVCSMCVTSMCTCMHMHVCVCDYLDMQVSKNTQFTTAFNWGHSWNPLLRGAPGVGRSLVAARLLGWGATGMGAAGIGGCWDGGPLGGGCWGGGPLGWGAARMGGLWDGGC